MPSKKLANLLKVEDKLHTLYLAKQTGEEYHPLYKKDKELFRRLVRADLRLEREFKRYQKNLVGRLDEIIDWNKYNAQLLTAAVSDLISAVWDNEALKIKVLLTKSLIDVIEAGGLYTEKELKIDTDWTGESGTASKFLKNYTVKLAGKINKTTLAGIKDSIGLSLELGEGKTEAASRLISFIDNPRRAATIAHTETVRAFTAGRLAVGAQVGADRKRWSATIGACPICAPLDNEVVALDGKFTSGISAPPAHPNCRCLIQLLMPDQNPEPIEPDSLLEDLFNDL